MSEQPTLAALRRKEQDAWKVYDEVTASAWKAYDEVTASARKAYEDARAAWERAKQKGGR